jgi:hypothetical protein
MLVLLLVGSASLMAQADDPFPEVNMNKYPDNMTFFGQVLLDGQVQPDGTVVAVYCGDELRGKGIVKKQGKHEHCAKFVIYGETKGDPLHFKVCTGGRVIEVDQGETYLTNSKLGSTAGYYLIDLPVPVVTTPSQEGWATTCLPFNAEVPSGVTVYVATGIKEGELVMKAPATGAGASVLPKNTPVLLKSEGLASYEWLARVADGDVSADGNIFVGTTEPTAVEPNSVLTLGHSKQTGEIGFWRYTGASIAANRAYITDVPASVRGLSIRIDDATGIDVNRESRGGYGSWYGLDGHRISGEPAVPGIYVREGKKVIKK